jgi:hypothetical protein
MEISANNDRGTIYIVEFACALVIAVNIYCNGKVIHRIFFYFYLTKGCLIYNI